jgi:hypothetical protein
MKHTIFSFPLKMNANRKMNSTNLSPNATMTHGLTRSFDDTTKDRTPYIHIGGIGKADMSYMQERKKVWKKGR